MSGDGILEISGFTIELTSKGMKNVVVCALCRVFFLFFHYLLFFV